VAQDDRSCHCRSCRGSCRLCVASLVSYLQAAVDQLLRPIYGRGRVPAARALLVADRDAGLARVGEAVSVAGIERDHGLRALNVFCQRACDHQGRSGLVVELDVPTLVRALRATEERVSGLCHRLPGAMDTGGLGLLSKEDFHQTLADRDYLVV